MKKVYFVEGGQVHEVELDDLVDELSMEGKWIKHHYRVSSLEELSEEDIWRALWEYPELPNAYPTREQAEEAVMRGDW